jgi:hypothetical protein
MAPFLIVNGAGTPLGRHLAPGLLPAFDDSREMPAYLPSNAVVGVCPVAGIAKAHAEIIKSILARPNMLLSFSTRRG